MAWPISHEPERDLGATLVNLDLFAWLGIATTFVAIMALWLTSMFDFTMMLMVCALSIEIAFLLIVHLARNIFSQLPSQKLSRAKSLEYRKATLAEELKKVDDELAEVYNGCAHIPKRTPDFTELTDEEKKKAQDVIDELKIRRK